jgi:hypothetical protein
MMLYEGCQILVFEKDLGKAGEDLMAAMKKDSPGRKIEGHEVFTFTEKLEQDQWTLFVTRPRGDVLLCATQEEFLTEVLKRFAKPGGQRALPPELPEWKQVDPSADFWSIRHYDAGSALLDPSSPLRAKAAANVPDPGAIGTTISLRKDDKILSVRYLTKSENGLEIARAQWDHEAEKLKPKIKWAEPGVVDVGFTRDKEFEPGMFIFVLLAVLGHAIYI